MVKRHDPKGILFRPEHVYEASKIVGLTGKMHCVDDPSARLRLRRRKDARAARSHDGDIVYRWSTR